MRGMSRAVRRQMPMKIERRTLQCEPVYPGTKVMRLKLRPVVYGPLPVALWMTLASSCIKGVGKSLGADPQPSEPTDSF